MKTATVTGTTLNIPKCRWAPGFTLPRHASVCDVQHSEHDRQVRSRSFGLLCKVCITKTIFRRYDERKPLITSVTAAFEADVIGLQEVYFGEPLGGKGSQSALIAAACGPSYEFIDAATPAPFPQPPSDPSFALDGNAVVFNSAKLRLVSHGVLPVSPVRCAQAALFEIKASSLRVLFVNTHLHHELDAASAELRAAQAATVCEWIKDWPSKASMYLLVIAFRCRLVDLVPLRPFCERPHRYLNHFPRALS